MFNLTPLPKKLFSLIPPPIVAPVVPAPAPREISPVGFSTTCNSITFKLGDEPSLISVVTFLKMKNIH